MDTEMPLANGSARNDSLGKLWLDWEWREIYDVTRLGNKRGRSFNLAARVVVAMPRPSTSSARVRYLTMTLSCGLEIMGHGVYFYSGCSGLAFASGVLGFGLGCWIGWM